MASLLDGVDLRTQMAGQNRLELLLFRLSGRQLFGINVFKVQEVIQCPGLTRVPGSHPVVRGIAKLRGKTVPVMDLSRAIGGPPMEDTQGRFVIITEYNKRIQGFLVNAVDRIINMNWENILPPPKGAAGGSYLTAVTQVDKQLVEIIDVEKVLSEVVGGSEQVSERVIDTQANAISHQVLVVDDSVVARNQVKRVLDQIGVQCTLKNNGAEALEQLHQWADERPQGRVSDWLALVISDIEMPKLDGFEVLELAEPGTLVVFVTAYDEYALRAFDVHAVDYLLKPIEDNQLINKISTYFRLIAKERNLNRVLEQNVAERTAELAQANQYLENIITYMGEALLVLSPQGEIKMVNPAACRMLDYTDEDLLGMSIGDVFEEEGDEQAGAFMGIWLEALIRTGALSKIEARFIAKDGRRVPILFSRTAVKDLGGQITDIICIAKDMTGYVRIDDQEPFEMRRNTAEEMS